jgi:hypothetical protein
MVSGLTLDVRAAGVSYTDVDSYTPEHLLHSIMHFRALDFMTFLFDTLHVFFQRRM